MPLLLFLTFLSTHLLRIGRTAALLLQKYGPLTISAERGVLGMQFGCALIEPALIERCARVWQGFRSAAVCLFDVVGDVYTWCMNVMCSVTI
jgi:hypothetical protein